MNSVAEVTGKTKALGEQFAAPECLTLSRDDLIIAIVFECSDAVHHVGHAKG